MRMTRFLLVALFVLIGGYVSVFGQEAPKVCISQESANRCADLAQNEQVQVQKIDLLEKAIRERDKIIEDLKIKLAMETQRATDSEANNLRLTAVMEGLLKAYTKPKKWGLIVF